VVIGNGEGAPETTEVCVELLSSRLSIDSLLLNTYSASGRRTVHQATTALRAPAGCDVIVVRFRFRPVALLNFSTCH